MKLTLRIIFFCFLVIPSYIHSQTYEKEMLYAGRKSQRFFFNNLNGALRNYTNAIKLAPNNYEPYWRRGQLRRRLAKKYLLKENITQHHINDSLSKVDFNTALFLCDEAINLNPIDTLYWHRGFVKKDLGNLEGACQDFIKSGEIGKPVYINNCIEKKE